MSRDLVVALSGGIGGAKLALGLSRILPADNLLVVANVGDDFEHLGLHISPDTDTLMYTLAGLDNTKLGWGRHDETWSFMKTLTALGGEDWFRLGDRVPGTPFGGPARSRRNKTRRCSLTLCAGAWRLTMESERDVWNTTYFHSAIRKRIGETLLAGYDLSQPLPDRMRALLVQLEKPSAEREADRRHPLPPNSSQ
jgi:2-phospho-L-lactate transferase CofD